MGRPGIKYHNMANGKINVPKIGFAIFIAAVLILAWLPGRAQIAPKGAIEIEEGGKLWITGSASVVDYTCRAEQLSGNGNIENASEPQQNIKGHGAVSIRVSVPVKSLECGKRAMNNDMYEALKADKYPSIHYQLLNATLVDSNRASSKEEPGWINIQTIGVLEIAGVKDTTQIFVRGRLLSKDRFRVRGSKGVSMNTYDIKPPTALLGLIKASSELTVNFDVTVRLNNGSKASTDFRRK
jgi:hypothetical protein